MVDATPGITKAVTATVATLLGGAISAYAVKILQHKWPWLMDDTTIQATPVILTAFITGAATWLAPHSVTKP